MINELVTDAAKYGALASQGKLAVQWRMVVNGSHRAFIKWTESGTRTAGAFELDMECN